MQSELGSFIKYGRKCWGCECCKRTISTDFRHFVRISEEEFDSIDSKGNKYRRKLYQRWHLRCALSIKDLNEYEKTLLGPVLMVLHEAQDRPRIDFQVLNAQECV